jgi:hypothetical protein
MDSLRDLSYAAPAPNKAGRVPEENVSFLTWLEATGLAEWVRTSFAGYPIMITCHAIGMSIMVGLSLVLDARLLGALPAVPFSSIQRFLGVAWIGFGINFISGAALFTTKAPEYAVHTIFVVKMSLVILGAISAAMLLTALGRDSAKWSTGAVPANVRVVAVLSIVFWVTAIVTGRLTAYV